MNRYNIEKVANAIIYFIDNNIEHFGKTKLMKIMFFSDKLHLQKYGRTIFADTYYKYDRGPVAHLTYNILNSINEVENDDLQEYTNDFANRIELTTVNDGDNQITTFIQKQDFRSEIFSKSELSVFDTIAKQYKAYTKDEISKESHELPEYINTKLNEIIPEIEMIDDMKMKEYVDYCQQENNSFDKFVS